MWSVCGALVLHLSTGGSWVRIPLYPPRRDLGQVLNLQLPVALRHVNSYTVSITFHDGLSFDDLAADAERRLFRSLVSNPSHVLSRHLPAIKTTNYNLRPWFHPPRKGYL